MVDGREVATRAATATMLYVAGVVTGPVGPFLVPAAKELSSPHMSRLTDLWTRWQGDSVARAIQALDEAERLIAKDAEQLLNAVMNSPQLLAHFARALSAVYESEVEAKVSAMARSMATAAQDESALDEEHIFVDAIRRLESAHISFLAHAAGCVDRSRGPNSDPEQELTVAEVTVAASLSAAAAEPVVRTLHGSGCITLDVPFRGHALMMNAPTSDQDVHVTEFGLAVLARLGAPAR